MQSGMPHEVLLLYNGKVATLESDSSFEEAIAVSPSTGLVLATGGSKQLLTAYGGQPNTRTVDVGGRTIIPGLIDSHLHFIREGNNFTMELRWDGVRSLRQALAMVADQARRTPAGQWVRVVGGWCEAQFEEKRLPTLAELDEAGGDRPVFVLHLYDCALVNRAGMALLGYTAATPNPPSGEIVRHADGTPTGVLIARPNAFLLYNTLDKLPKLSDADKRNSTIAYGRELNRFGLTSCLDPGGGFQAYPNDYSVIKQLDEDKALTVRISYSLFPQRPKKELDDFKAWAAIVKPGDGSAFLRMLGAGEMLAFSAADFEDFKEARPDLGHDMEGDLLPIVRFLVSKRWPFRLHATYGESIERELALFEQVEHEQPGSLSSLHWFIDHAETISERDIARIKALGGGIAVQHRMAFQGEYFVQRYGAAEATHSPPIAAMRHLNVPVGAGTDGTRVATYNPWVSLQWLVTGKTVAGLQLYTPNYTDCDPNSNVSTRAEALRMWTMDNTWFCNEEHLKGKLAPGMFADLAVLKQDYFTIDENSIGQIEADMTMVAGKVVYVDPLSYSAYQALPLPAPYDPATISPSWSPVRVYGGYQLAASTAWPGETPGTVPAEQAIYASKASSQPHAAMAKHTVATLNPTEFFTAGHDC